MAQDRRLTRRETPKAGAAIPACAALPGTAAAQPPAHAAGQLARPVLEHYARKQPAKLMAIAAATGAALVLVRPWRLLSVTAVLAAVLKTSDVADVVNTLMQKNTSPPRKDPP